MIALLYYLIKVVICSDILFLYYHLALRNKIFHQWNRFYLLAVVILSLTIPLAQFTFIHGADKPPGAMQLLQVVQSADNYMEEIYIQGHRSITTEQWIESGYILVSLFIFITVVLAFVRIYLLIKKHQVQLVDEIKVVSTEVKGTPFSFFHYIFWNAKIDINSPAGRQIFQHELVHIKDAHTYDKLFMQLTLVGFWCNPFFWLIRKELNLIHEFIADKKSIQHKDTAALAAMILQAAYPHQYHAITNQFFQSSIKRRILMLTKIKNPRITYFSRMLALPIIAFVILAFTVRTKQQINPFIPLSKEITVIIDAGHGKQNGVTTGAQSGSAYESDIVLALAKKIKELNANPKLKILLTRASDDNIDLQKRTDFAQEKKADLFISLHVAASVTNNATRGMEVYVSNKNTPYQKQSELLGSVIKQELTLLYPTNPDLIKQATGIWVIDKNSCPSVLVECGYITNVKDREFITNENNQTAIAKKILAAIERYAISFDTDTGHLLQSKQKSTGDTGRLQVTDYRIAVQNLSLADFTYSDRPLLIINGKTVSIEFLFNKVLTGKKGIVYPKNDPEAIGQFGDKARNGVVILEDAKIEEANKKSSGKINGKNNSSLKKEEKKSFVNVSFKELTPEDFKKDTIPETEAFIDANEWRTFLQKNLSSIIDELSTKIPSGKYAVQVKFLVKKNGTLSEIKVLKDPGYGIAEKIEKLMKMSPKWTPAYQKGQIVASYHTQPLTLIITK